MKKARTLLAIILVCMLTVSLSPSAFARESKSTRNGTSLYPLYWSAYTESDIQNLQNVLTSKVSLLKHALQTDADITLTANESIVSLSFFRATLNPAEVMAYIVLAAKLGEFAKGLKHASAVERPVENEKYAFRCFLLRLGFIGPEYKTERKILLAPLEGSTAFKNRLQEVQAE